MNINTVFQQIASSPMNKWVGGGDAFDIGRANARSVLALFEPHENAVFLDFGCGIGRTAAGILEQRPTATVVGVDIVPDMIKFCRETIEPFFPQTKFYCSETPHRFFDTFKTEKGIAEPEEQVFSRLADSSDVAFAFSVFTHLQPEETLHYLCRLRNCLKPAGTLIISAFLLDAFSRNRMNCGGVFREFPRQVRDTEDCYMAGERGEFVAYDTSLLTRLLFDAGFHVGMIVFGSWRGSKAGFGIPTFQDILVVHQFASLPLDFDSERYLALNGDVARDGVKAESHYLRFGFYEKRRYK